MDYKSMRIAFLVFFGLLMIIFAAVTWPFYKAIFLALTFAIIFAPFNRIILERLKLPRYLASLLTTVGIAVCVIMPLVYFSGLIITQVSGFINEFYLQLEKGTFSTTLNLAVETINRGLVRIIGSSPSNEEIISAILSSLKGVGMTFYEFSPRVLSTTISIFVNFVLMLLFLVVFLAEGRPLFNWFMETSPLSAEHSKELSHEVRVTVTSSVTAMIVVAIVQGALLGIGYWVAGFNHSYGWALLSIVLSLIPVVGAASCYVVASLTLFFSGNVKGALMFMAFGLLIISTIDNLIKAFLVKGSSRIHPLLVFVAIVGMVKLTGPIGLIVGPVLLAIFLASLRIYRREFAGMK